MNQKEAYNIIQALKKLGATDSQIITFIEFIETSDPKLLDKISNKELTTFLIDTYSNLQRILKSDNMQKEAEYQLQMTKAKLESLGIVTSDLDKK